MSDPVRRDPVPGGETSYDGELTPEVFAQLVAEGLRLRQRFDRATAGMRTFTPEERLRRVR